MVQPYASNLFFGRIQMQWDVYKTHETKLITFELMLIPSPEI